MRVDHVARWLAHASPRIYRIARALWRLSKRIVPIEDHYWAKRNHYNYYADIVRLCREYEPAGGHVIDVGAGPTQVLRRLDWFAHRVALDRTYVPPRATIDAICMDFVNYHPDRYFDLVLCLQVLEHLDDPAPFARKLLNTGRTVIISVPYKWPRGFHPPHVQDPVDEATLLTWTRQSPVETRVVANGSQRLIAVYRDSVTGPRPRRAPDGAVHSDGRYDRVSR